MSQVPVYVINLAKCTDRWRAIKNNLDRVGLTATRIEAIDGSVTPIDDLSMWQGGVGPGHLACARSHYLALENFIHTNAAAALILEDDAEIGQTLPQVIQSLYWWPDGSGVVQLAATRNPHTCIPLGPVKGTTGDGRELRKMLCGRHRDVGAEGYLINREAASMILELAPEVPMPIDQMLFNMVDSPLGRVIKPLQMLPAPIRHRPQHEVGSFTGSVSYFGDRVWKNSRIHRLKNKFNLYIQVMANKAIRVNVLFKG